MRIERTVDLETCRELRRQVFIEEQGVPEAEEWDGRDKDAIHLLASRDGRPMGTARILLLGSTAKIGRVCVLPEARGTGLGVALLRAAMDVLRGCPGVTHATLGAQVQVIGFYERLGFQAHGDIYDDAGIPHRDMTRAL